jgi:hypothetical protein
MKPTVIQKFRTAKLLLGLLVSAAALTATVLQASAQQQKRPNVVMLMTDDTGWNDFGAYSGGGAALGHPTPNIDRIAKEGATFQIGTVKRAVRQAAPRSLPVAFQSVRRFPSWSRQVMRML